MALGQGIQLGDGVWTIGGDTSGLDAAVDRSRGTVTGFMDTLQSGSTQIQGTLNSLGNAFMALGGGISGALLGAAYKTADLADGLDEMNKRIGVSTTTLSEWRYILGLNGAGIEDLEAAMTKLNMQMTLTDLSADKKSAKTKTDTFANQENALSVRALELQYQSAIEKLNEMAWSHKFNTTELQQQQVEIEQLALKLQKAQAGLSDVAGATTQSAEELNKLTDGLRGLGLTLDQVQAMTPQDRFMAITSALARMSDETMRGQLAFEIFGKAGLKLLPTLALGEAGIEKLRQKANELGIVMDPATVERMAALKDSLDTLKFAFEGLMITAGAQLGQMLTEQMPKIEAAIKTIREFLNEHPDFIESALKFGLGMAGAGGAMKVGATGLGIAASIANVGSLALAYKGLKATGAGAAVATDIAQIGGAAAKVIKPVGDVIEVSARTGFAMKGMSTVATYATETIAGYGAATGATVVGSEALAAGATGAGSAVTGLGSAILGSIAFPALAAAGVFVGIPLLIDKLGLYQKESDAAASATVKTGETMAMATQYEIEQMTARANAESWYATASIDKQKSVTNEQVAEMQSRNEAQRMMLLAGINMTTEAGSAEREAAMAALKVQTDAADEELLIFQRRAWASQQQTDETWASTNSQGEAYVALTQTVDSAQQQMIDILLSSSQAAMKNASDLGNFFVNEMGQTLNQQIAAAAQAAGAIAQESQAATQQIMSGAGTGPGTVPMMPMGPDLGGFGDLFMANAMPNGGMGGGMGYDMSGMDMGMGGGMDGVNWWGADMFGGGGGWDWPHMPEWPRIPTALEMLAAQNEQRGGGQIQQPAPAQPIQMPAGRPPSRLQDLIDSQTAKAASPMSFGSGAITVTMNLTGPVNVQTKSDIANVARQLGSQLQTELRNRGIR